MCCLAPSDDHAADERLTWQALLLLQGYGLSHGMAYVTLFNDVCRFLPAPSYILQFVSVLTMSLVVSAWAMPLGVKQE